MGTKLNQVFLNRATGQWKVSFPDLLKSDGAAFRVAGNIDRAF